MPKRKSNEAGAFHRWSVSVATEYWCLLKEMFDYFLFDDADPTITYCEGEESPFDLLRMRLWAQRLAKQLALTPARVERYLRENDKEEHIDPVLFLLSDKEAGENE